VRPVSQVPALPDADLNLSDNERKMAEELITNMNAPFDPAKYTDEYRTELQQLIQKKLEGKEVAVAPAAPKANVIDLMQALKESLAATASDVGTPVKAEPEATPAKPAAGRKRAVSTDNETEAKEKTGTAAAKPSVSAFLSEDAAETTATATTKKLRRKKAQA
ncbi:hypothetical protein MXD81_12765, partial [Microbacteriaceae bacterium K1510]|nr:hypothetical protein [Microbacteriaceae bacterium K1510]